MFEIKVTVELPGIPEAVNNLANALRGQTCGITTSPAIVPVTDEAPATVADVVPMAQVPKATPEKEPEVISSPVPDAPPLRTYTFDDISNAGAELCSQGEEMIQRLTNMLKTKYGVESIVDLSDDRFNELAADLIALGAKLG